MKFSEYNLKRVRNINSKPIRSENQYVLYWMQAYRRFDSNHALEYALFLAKKYKKKLVVYEGLRMDYKWNSERIHRFILEGMCDNFKRAESLGISYWCFVETPENLGRGILKKIAETAIAVVTDDFPAFIIPEQTEALGKSIDCTLFSIDANGIVPLELYGEPASAARILRPRIHKLFPEAYLHMPKLKFTKRNFSGMKEDRKPPFQTFSCKKNDISAILGKIKFQNSVKPVPDTVGGRIRAELILKKFIADHLQYYSEKRSLPESPQNTPVSNLSAYLHFGYISVPEIVEKVLNSVEDEKWAPDLLNTNFTGKREGYYHENASINSFFDELLTWRDLGYLLFWKKKEFSKDLNILPDWVKKNFHKHKKDKREYLYTKEEFENARTHDKIWNAAQIQLTKTGTIHNYLRMLWAKKVLEWSKSYDSAFEILEDLNNKYAYDGRNPNSYTGILWCFGAFDRPWFPERPVYGTVRYMSSDATVRKFKMKPYLEYIESLSSISLF